MSKSGIILIIVGSLILASNLGLLEWGWLHQWWPLILIGVGIWSLLDPNRAERTRRPRDDKLP